MTDLISVNFDSWSAPNNNIGMLTISDKIGSKESQTLDTFNLLGFMMSRFYQKDADYIF